MDNLWAPWRLPYVVAASKPPAGELPCFICRGLTETDDRRNLIVRRTPLGVVILNRFPYNNGHLLIAPQAHKAGLDELTPEEHLDLMTTITHFLQQFDRLMKPDGYNIGLNLGRSAGAGLPGHLHWHVVPRWDGDTNYMPILADTKVIVQSLDALFDLLTKTEAP
ncbi:MAG TPA: HIT domain-containing protein [Gemmataceae bacterium]|nr:HIT domain-containing protein [Gemmataceae bacterium]